MKKPTEKSVGFLFAFNVGLIIGERESIELDDLCIIFLDYYCMTNVLFDAFMFLIDVSDIDVLVLTHVLFYILLLIHFYYSLGIKYYLCNTDSTDRFFFFYH